MMASILQEIAAGFYTTLNSFHLLRKYSKILIYSLAFPLSSLFLTPLLLKAANMLPTHPIIEWLVALIISFIGLTIFDLIYLAGATYLFKAWGYLPSITSLISSLRSKINMILLWTGISTLVTVAIKMGVAALFNIPDSHISIIFFDYIWWIVNLLLIPIIADSSFTLFNASKIMFMYVREKWAFLISAGLSFYLIKKLIDTIFYVTLFLITPRLLLATHLVTYEHLVPQQNSAHGILALLAIGVLISSILSAVMFAAQIILATTSYVYYTGRSFDGFVQSWKQLLINSLITVIMYFLILAALSSLLMLITIRIPFIGSLFMHFFSKGNV